METHGNPWKPMEPHISLIFPIWFSIWFISSPAHISLELDLDLRYKYHSWLCTLRDGADVACPQTKRARQGGFPGHGMNRQGQRLGGGVGKLQVRGPGPVRGQDRTGDEDLPWKNAGKHVECRISWGCRDI